MPITSVADLLAALRDSPLLPPEQIQELAARQAGWADARALARELLQRDWVTAYQINHLFQGRGQDLVLGPYVLLERVGEGGMGQVFKARHTKLGRVVALKVIRRERLANPRTVRRFQREIRAAAQLVHPNVIVALDAMEVNGTHFYAMDFVEGIDLGRLVKQRGPLPVAQACDCIRQAALGLQHAFEQGLVHRDIKPSNLLLAAKGGVVKLLDLGLARTDQPLEEDESSTLTQEGMVMGTPDYMAPEQAQQSHAVDIRADVYSLGCTLYFLLTGHVPFPGGSMAHKLLRVQMEEPAAVESLRPDLPAGLGLVLRRMMAKSPEARYAVPAEAAAALEPYCRAALPVAVPLAAGRGPQPTSATPTPPAVPVPSPPLQETPPPSAGESVASLAEGSPSAPRRGRARLRWLVAGGAGCFLLAAAAVAAVVMSRPGHPPTNGPQPQKPDPSPLDRLDPEKVPADERFRWQPDGLVAVLGTHRVRHQGLIRGFAVRPDGKQWVATGGTDGFIRLADSELLHEQAAWMAHPGGVFSLAFSADGTRLASGGADGVVRLWDAVAGKELEKFTGHTGSVMAVALSSDGQRILSGGADKTVRLWDVAALKELQRFAEHTTPVTAVALAPDGRHALSAGGTRDAKMQAVDCDVRLWDLDTGKQEAVFTGHTSTVTSLALSPDGKRLLSGSADTTVRLWDMASRKELKRSPALTGAVGSVAFAPDGSFAVCTLQAGSAHLLDMDNLRSLRAVPAQAAAAVLLPDRRRLLLADGNTLRMWDVEANQEVRPVVGHTAGVVALGFTRDGRRLLSGGADGTLRLWDMETGLELGHFPGQPSNASMVCALSPDGRYALSASSASSDYFIHLWDTAAGRDLRQLKGHASAVTNLAFAADGRLALSAAAGRPVGAAVTDTELRLWDVESGQEVRKLWGNTKGVIQAGFFPDSARVFSLGRDETARLWDVKTGTDPRVLKMPGASAVVFTPDAQTAYSGGADGSVTRWDLGGKAPASYLFLRYHTAVVQSLALAPDGKTLASAGQDGRVVLWEVPAGKKLREWEQPGGVARVAFAPDGRHLATANGNATVYIIRVEAPPSTP